jgi:hypothetical protein
MRRVLVVLLVIATVTAPVASTAAAAGPRRGFVLYLHAGGFVIDARSALGSGGVRLMLDRHGEVAYYYVKAQVGAGTVRARFGRLGAFDLRFDPERGEGPLGCGGSEGWQWGTFVGTLAFRGEHDYADVDAHRARGWFRTRPAESCARGGGGHRDSRATASKVGPIAETGVELYGKTASRLPGRDFYFFTQNRPGGVRTVFNAFREERREGMLIERGAQVYGGAAAFDWNLGVGTARVEPPAPFSGSGFYRSGPEGRRPSWTGSLWVPVLGARPMRLTGAAFAPRLGAAS